MAFDRCEQADAERVVAEEQLNPADVRYAAMNLLARREHSRRELKQKLMKRFGDEEIVASQLDQLANENLQSDSRYAESFVRQRYNRGYGPLRIRQEMGQKGISDAEADNAMHAEDYDWAASAEAVLQRKYGDSEPEDLKEKARRSRFMQYRGFSLEHFREWV